MQTKTWAEVLQRLLDENVLLEDEKGIIQIHPQYYQLLNKTIPGSTSGQNRSRAEKLTKAYIELWPKKIMSGGRPVRQGPTTIAKKLLVFMNKHPKVTDEQILNAASRYVATKIKDGWQMCVCSDYFISKNDTSQLETYIMDPELGSKDFAKKTVNLTQKLL
jgi:hypothetical protein